jgi:hypothetical protein
MCARWQNPLLLWLLGLLLWLQGRHIWRITPRMPEPPGHRTGTAAGRGSLVRLLVAGGLRSRRRGSPTQDQSLCGQLVRRPIHSTATGYSYATWAENLSLCILSASHSAIRMGEAFLSKIEVAVRRVRAEFGETRERLPLNYG